MHSKIFQIILLVSICFVLINGARTKKKKIPAATSSEFFASLPEDDGTDVLGWENSVKEKLQTKTSEELSMLKTYLYERLKNGYAPEEAKKKEEKQKEKKKERKRKKKNGASQETVVAPKTVEPNNDNNGQTGEKSTKHEYELVSTTDIPPEEEKIYLHILLINSVSLVHSSMLDIIRILEFTLQIGSHQAFHEKCYRLLQDVGKNFEATEGDLGKKELGYLEKFLEKLKTKIDFDLLGRDDLIPETAQKERPINYEIGIGLYHLLLNVLNKAKISKAVKKPDDLVALFRYLVVLQSDEPKLRETQTNAEIIPNRKTGYSSLVKNNKRIFDKIENQSKMAIENWRKFLDQEKQWDQQDMINYSKELPNVIENYDGSESKSIQNINGVQMIRHIQLEALSAGTDEDDIFQKFSSSTFYMHNRQVLMKKAFDYLDEDYIPKIENSNTITEDQFKLLQSVLLTVRKLELPLSLANRIEAIFLKEKEKWMTEGAESLKVKIMENALRQLKSCASLV